MFVLPDYIERVIHHEPNTGCWLAAGVGVEYFHGYARIRPPGTRVRRRLHRLVYEALRGPIGEGLTLDHLCRVRCCVNPWHAEPVTIGENVLRGFAPPAVNARQTHCLRGHPLGAWSLRRRRPCALCRARPQHAQVVALQETPLPIPGVKLL